MDLFSIINNCSSYFTPEWKNTYSTFMEKEHWVLFARKLVSFLETEHQNNDLLPYFDEEVIPPKQEIYNCFKGIFETSKKKELSDSILIKQWAETIEQIPFEYILIVFGQRLTSASIQDQKAIPPLKSTLLTSSFRPYNEQICIATRAWEKHIGRSQDDFWGTIKGNPKQKEEKIKSIISEMIDTQTWWNVFHHYKHGLVYEIRVASGHGIRWNKQGTELIGFLEPFLNDE